MAIVDWTQAINGLAGALVLSSAVMLFLAALAFRRARRGRFLLVTAAFLVLFLRALWVVWALFRGEAWETLFGVASIGDILLVFLLYLAVIR